MPRGTFPYFKPARSSAKPPEPKKPKDPALYRNLDARQRVLRMAGYKKPSAVTLPKVNLPD